MSTWRFDDQDPAQVWFDEDVQGFAPAVRASLERAFIELLEEDPLKNQCEVVQGEFVYIKRIQPDLVDNELIPALLLTYRASKRDKKIRKLELHRAADTAPNGLKSTNAQILATLHRLIAIALNRAKRHDH